MPHPGCSRYREDLALLAGDDLPAGAERVAAEEHAAGCAGCANLLTALAGDLVLVTTAARQPDPVHDSLVASVLAHAASEAVADGLYRPATARKRSDMGLVAFGRVAAAVGLVAAAGVLGVSLLSHEGSSLPSDPGTQPVADAQVAAPPSVATPTPIDAPAEAPAAAVTSLVTTSDLAIGASPAPRQAPKEQEFRPVRVQRAGGSAIALQWESDGRETARDGGSKAYKVLASASPRDFSEARPVLVAGRSLVSSDRLPSHQRTDRSLTFFRVE